MAHDHVVELYVGPDAIRVDVWDRYDINLSMLEAGTAWTFTFWRSSTARETAWEVLTDPERGVKLGHVVTLSIDNDAVLTGRVETLEIGDANGDRAGFEVVISGRDLAGPAISWDADPTLSLKGKPLLESLAALFRRVQLPVEFGEHADPRANTRSLRTPRRGRHGAVTRPHRRPVDVKHPDIGEKIWQVTERIVRGLGYRIWVTPGHEAGNCGIVVDTPNYGGERLFSFTRAIVDGVATAETNILKGREISNIRDVPTEVTVYADAPRGDNESARLRRTMVNGYLNSAEITRGLVAEDIFPQPRYVRSQQAKSDEAAQQEAARVIAEAMERFRMYRCTVQGHGQRGRVYTPNSMSHVRDDIFPLREDMLILSCKFSGGRGIGQTTEVVLGPNGALSSEPVPS